MLATTALPILASVARVIVWVPYPFYGEWSAFQFQDLRDIGIPIALGIATLFALPWTVGRIRRRGLRILLESTVAAIGALATAASVLAAAAPTTRPWKPISHWCSDRQARCPETPERATAGILSDWGFMLDECRGLEARLGARVETCAEGGWRVSTNQGMTGYEKRFDAQGKLIGIDSWCDSGPPFSKRFGVGAGTCQQLRVAEICRGHDAWAELTR
ncbi:MAG: hypothetical protein JST54_24310 [Deltaproteobacteria bacterium]|nr:hypothetical protein [Deltaproteobacteria bacterium]